MTDYFYLYPVSCLLKNLMYHQAHVFLTFFVVFAFTKWEDCIARTAPNLWNPVEPPQNTTLMAADVWAFGTFMWEVCFSHYQKKIESESFFNFLSRVEWLCVSNFLLRSRDEVHLSLGPTVAVVDFGMNKIHWKNGKMS